MTDKFDPFVPKFMPIHEECYKGGSKHKFVPVYEDIPYSSEFGIITENTLFENKIHKIPKKYKTRKALTSYICEWCGKLGDKQ